MIRLQLSAADLAGTRFAPDPGPMVDVALAGRLLQRRDRTPGLDAWRTAARPLDARARPLLDLVPPTGLNCGFLAPLSATLDEGLALMREQAPEHDVPGEVVDVIGARTPSRQARALARGHEDGWTALETAIRHTHDALVAGWEPALAARRRRDVTRRGELLATAGLAAALGGLHRTVRLVGDILEISDRPDWYVPLDGSGLILVPTAFLVDEVRVHVPDSGPTKLYYPVGFPPRPTADPLEPLLGRTRAAVLRAAVTGAGTGELATRVGISPASASQHAAVLRDAGLLSTARVGKSVRHTVTGAGAALLGT